MDKTFYCATCIDGSENAIPLINNILFNARSRYVDKDQIYYFDVQTLPNPSTGHIMDVSDFLMRVSYDIVVSQKGISVILRYPRKNVTIGSSLAFDAVKTVNKFFYKNQWMVKDYLCLEFFYPLEDYFYAEFIKGVLADMQPAASI